MKKHIAILLVSAILFSIFPLNVFAAYPYNGKYGQGTYADPVDYMKVYNDVLRDKYTISEPIATFSILDPNKNTLITSSDTAQTLSMFLGDKVTFKDLSTLGSGNNITKYDFQITHKGALVKQYYKKADIENATGFTFDDVGEYNIYLNVMDDTPKEKTDYWGNWSFNGSHKAIGRNPGPTDSTDDDFYGYWYFVEIKVIVSPHTLTETHYDIDNGQELSKNAYSNITSSNYTTYAKNPQQLPGYTYMGSKAGYTWSEAEASTMSDPTVTSRNAKYGYVNYADNKGSNNAFHWYYYKKIPGLHPNFAIKYTGNDYTDKELTVPNLPITANLVDLSTGEDITNWTWEYKTTNNPSFQTFSTLQNPDMELDEETIYTFRLTVKNATEQKSVEHSVTVKKGTTPPPTSSGIPPISVITGPMERMAGSSISFSGSSSVDPDGTIVQYIWDIPGANISSITSGGKVANAWYPQVGEYDLFLTVVDNDGLIGESMTSIKITPPVPTAVINITGIPKVNRKLTVSGSNSTSPTHYPINKYTWAMTNAADAKYVGTFGSDVSKDMILKKAQPYRYDLSVVNTYGLSDTETKSITIAPDVEPVADFSVSAQVLRNPNDTNYSTITVTNNSKSTDGDTIKKTVAFYAYDSNNDGNFDNETWYMSKDGTTWAASGLTYANLNSLDLYNLAGASNPANFILKTKQVGKYKFEVKTIEDIAAADTIPTLLTAADYKTAITTTSKPLSSKIVEVINTAPQISFEVKKKKEVDIFIFTDYTGAKLDSLQAAINVKKSQLVPLNVDANFVIVNNSKKIGTKTAKIYRFSKPFGMSFHKVEAWGPYGDSDNGIEDEIAYTNEIESDDKSPADMPAGKRAVSYSGGTYYDTSKSNSSYYSQGYTYNVRDNLGENHPVSFATYKAQGAYIWEVRNWHIEGLYNGEWTKDPTVLRTDTFDVNSIDLESIQTQPLRAGSDRYAFYLSDATSFDYSQAFGSTYAFGSLTDTVRNYIKNNGFKVSIIAPNAILDSNLIGEKVTDIASTGYFGFYTTFDGRTKSMGTLYNTKYAGDPVYPYDRGTNFGKIVEAYSGTKSYENVYENFLIMADGTVKKQTGRNDTFTTVPNLTGIVKKAGEYFLRANGDCYSENGVLVATNVSLLGDNPIVSRERIDRADGNDVYYDMFILNDGSIYATNPTNTYPHYVYEEYYSYDASGIHTGGPYYRKVTGAKYKVGAYILKTNGDVISMIDYRIKNDQFIVHEGYWSGYYLYIRKLTSGVSALEKLGDTYILTMTNGTRKYIYLERRARYSGGEFANFYYNQIGPTDITGPANDIIANYSFYGAWGEGATFILTGDGKLRVQGAYQEGNIDFNTFINSTPKLTNIKSFDGRIALANDGKVYYLSGYGSSGCTFTQMNINNVEKIVTKEFTDLSNYNNIKYYISYILTKDNLLYAIGGSLYGQAGIISTVISTPTVPNKPNVTLTQPALNYLMLRDVLNYFPDSRYYTTGQYTQALNDLLAAYSGDTSYTTNYILLNDEVDFTTAYSDIENDPKYSEAWKFLHEPYWFENSMGIASFHGQTLGSPITKYDKKGRYTINLRARDNPKNDERFKNDTNESFNYYKWSVGNQNVLLYVHEKPIALMDVSISQSGNTLTIVANDGGSYDLDHTSLANKGISQFEWSWRSESESSWHFERMNRSGLSSDTKYLIRLRVKDLEGAWSDYEVYTISPGDIIVDASPKSVTWTKNDVTTTISGVVINGTLQNIKYRWTTTTAKPTSGWTTDTRPSFTTAQTANGIWYLHMEATSSSGGTFYRYRGPYQIDKTPPAVDCSPTSNTSESAFDLTVTASDAGGSGLRQVNYKLATTTAKPSSGWITGGSSSFVVPVNVDGTYYLHMEAFDNAGNSFYRYRGPFTYLSNRPPAVSIYNTPSFVYEGDTLRINVVPSDPDNNPLSVVLQEKIGAGSFATVLNQSNVVSGSTVTYTRNNVGVGTYQYSVVVTDSFGATAPGTLTVTVYPLGVTAIVSHTTLWDQHRIDYNMAKSGYANSPRPYATFFPGESFVLAAQTTAIDSHSTVFASQVSCSILGSSFSTTLSDEGSNSWQGSLWDEVMMFWSDQAVTFRFRATYSNGTVKTQDVIINVRDDEFWRQHLKF